ncbi:DUF805 domain-containing protein [Pectinatus frisingensis]|uniref:DUF805 domain-containing protein n=1 Tax=Pectinatus frisingensis TaxID=865 RepID=UPI0015F61080|nr:DUF805 domain-containing protein [Pectinatus frisingensis]
MNFISDIKRYLENLGYSLFCPGGMSITDKIKLFFRERLGRKEFAIRLFIYIIIYIILKNIDISPSLVFPVTMIFFAYFISIVIRRCNDIELSRMKTILIIILNIIPVASVLSVIYLMLAKGKNASSEIIVKNN